MTPDEFKQIAEMLGGLSKQIKAISAKMQEERNQRAACPASRQLVRDPEDREFEKMGKEFRRVCSFKPGRARRR